MIIFLLGHKGMLGNCVLKYLISKENCTLITTECCWDTEEFKDTIRRFKGDYIINCIAALPGRTTSGDDLIKVNYELPMWLVKNTTARIILPGTDGEFSGNIPAESFYSVDAEADAQDVYGFYKAKLYNELKSNNSVRFIRTSIIGIELKTSFSILSWFLNQKAGSVLKGYTNQLWNGITTLEWAKICYLLVMDWNCERSGLKRVSSLIQVGTKKISKFDLLQIFDRVFQRQITISPIEAERPINRCLWPVNNQGPISDQLNELKLFYGL